MMGKETRQKLLFHIATIKKRGVTEEQKKRLIHIHEQYIKLLSLKAIKPGEIQRECKDIEEASNKYLKAIRPPGQLSEDEEKVFRLAKVRVEATVEAYRNLAKRCRLTYAGLGKRGRPGHWQKQIYIKQMARWYEDVKGSKARSGTYSTFPAFVRLCFGEIFPDDGLSDSLIKRAIIPSRKTK
jgi:hypothetical protein